MGIIGSGARSSQTTNAAASNNPSTNVATTSGLVQPALLARIRPHTTPSAAPATSVRPNMSRRVSVPRLSSTRRSTSGMRIRPIGTLIQKIHCQARPSATAPPTTGPAIRASPVMPLKMPSALARASRGNAALRSAIASGMTSAAPAPCAARAAISQPTFPASAQAADAATNNVRPATNTRRRPNRSPSAAPVSSSTAKHRL